MIIPNQPATPEAAPVVRDFAYYHSDYAAKLERYIAARCDCLRYALKPTGDTFQERQMTGFDLAQASNAAASECDIALALLLAFVATEAKAKNEVPNESA